MFAVEIYAAIRREEPARGGADFRIEPGYGRQDVPLFGAGRHSRQNRYTWLRTIDGHRTLGTRHTSSSRMIGDSFRFSFPTCSYR
jgi:hypothetical protein